MPPPGAFIQTSISSAVVRMTGLAFGCTGATTACLLVSEYRLHMGRDRNRGRAERQPGPATPPSSTQAQACAASSSSNVFVSTAVTLPDSSIMALAQAGAPITA